MHTKLTFFILAIFYFLIQKVSLAAPFEFESVPFDESHPQTYTLFMVDSSRRTSISKKSWLTHKNFSKIGPRFLRNSLATDEGISFAEKAEDVVPNLSWIRQCTNKLAKKNGKEYFIVELLKQNQSLKALNLIEPLTSNISDKHNEFVFQAALIIFPYEENLAMAYGFGNWKMLIEPSSIIPRWGLRMLTSVDMCDPDKVKRVITTHHRRRNPSSINEKTAKLEKIEAFGIEVGSEGIESMSALPGKEYKSSHLITGQDYLRFTVSSKENSKKSSKRVLANQSIKSLEEIAANFFNTTKGKGFQIHKRMKEFIDEEVKDQEVLRNLNTQFVNLINSKEGRLEVFVHSSLWRELQTSSLRFGDEKASSLFDILEKAKFKDLSQKIKIWYGKPGASTEVEIARFLFSIPIKYNDDFFRFDRGYWYEIDASRFESIKRIMRETKLPQDILELPLYSFKDTERSEKKSIDYKEANYNSRIVSVIKDKKGWDAILLDRLNVSLGGSNHRFEFADLLLRNKGDFYIVHVKRADASQLSHHREQVERSADFLASELKKGNAHNLLLRGIVNGLYESYDLPSKKAKNQGKRLTKGNKFQPLLSSLESKKKSFKEIVNENLLKIYKDDKNLSKNFKKKVSALVDYDFFKNYPEELVIALDALFDCIEMKNIKIKEMDEIIESFLESVKQAVQADSILFQDNILKKESLKRIKIVLAVVDDRNIERFLDDIKEAKKAIDEYKQKKTLKAFKVLKSKYDQKLKEQKNFKVNQKNKNPVFKNQDLWGLDRTRTVVQKYGFTFNLVIINEDEAAKWDAFGEIIEKEGNAEDSSGSEQKSDESDQEDSKGSSLAPPQKNKKANLKNLFKTLKDVEKKQLDLSKSLKISYFGNAGLGIYPTYITCPTIGDGDCFFHAAFTENGEGLNAISEKASIMRNSFCDAVQEDEYLEECKNLLYEHYLELSSIEQYEEIPENIAAKFKKNAVYIDARNKIISFGLDIPEQFQDEHLYSQDDIKVDISDDSIKTYVERFRTVGGEETYIPVRPGMSCPAEIIATQNNKRINIFTFNKNSGEIDLVKTVGNNGSIVNILIEGIHFVRMYNINENNNNYFQAAQIIKNYNLWCAQ